MLIWILKRFAPVLEQVEVYSSGDSRVFLTARTALASVTSFVLALLLGPAAIRWLRRRFRERIDSSSSRLNELQADKSATPTMGGLFIVGSIVFAVLLWGDLTNAYVQLALLTAVSFGALGAVDDWVKLRTDRNGLSIRQKLVTQCLLALVISSWLYTVQKDVPLGLDLVWPVGNWLLPLGLLFIPWSMLVLVGTSNAVNLTDGMDGLASGCTVSAGSAFVALAYLAGHRSLADYLSIPHMIGAGELGIVLGSLVGATLGFLWFNCYPAEVFMGDTGSLPIGGLLAFAALVTRQEFLLVIVGGIFVVETVSVIAQVLWFRRTGRRLILCSPLHNHFLFQGQHEMKVVVRFWIGSALLAIIAVASLKIR